MAASETETGLPDAWAVGGERFERFAEAQQYREEEVFEPLGRVGEDRIRALYRQALHRFEELYDMEFTYPALIIEDKGKYTTLGSLSPDEYAFYPWRTSVVEENPVITVNGPVNPFVDDEYPHADPVYYLPLSMREAVDRENYAIRYGAEDIAEMSEHLFALDVQLKMQMHYDMALREAMEPLRQDLLETFERFNPEIPVRETVFLGQERKHGMAVGGENRDYIKAGLGLMPELDPETGTFRRHDRALSIETPPSGSELFWRRLSGSALDTLARSSYHELVHTLHHATGGDSGGRLRAVSGKVAARTEGRGEYRQDIMRAAIEGLTVFEEYRRYGDEGRSGSRHHRYRKAVTAPEKGFFRNRIDRLLEKEDLFENPYHLAQFVSYAVHQAFKEEHDADEALDLTREYLLTCATTPVDMLGAAQNAFRMRGMDDVADLLEERAPVEEWMEEVAALGHDVEADGDE